MAAVSALIFANTPWREAYATPARHRRRRRVGSPPAQPRALVGRRPARHLLLRRRAGAQAGVPRGRPAHPGQGRRAGRCRRGWSHRAGPGLPRRRDLARRRGGCPARVGDPHRHRHRVRARGARRHRQPPAVRDALLPPDPRGRRRPHRHHDHRRLLHLRPRGRAAAARPRAARAVRGSHPAPDHLLVAPAAPGVRDVDPRARVRRPRHGRRCAPRASSCRSSPGRRCPP